MEIELTTLGYIQDVVKTAKLVGIESLIIEPGCIRGVDEKSTRVILHTKNVPAFDFGSIAISRIGVFTERLELAKTSTSFTIDAATHGTDATIQTGKDTPDAMYVRQLTFKGKGLKLDFRASNPVTVKCPRNLKDRMKYSFHLSSDALLYLQKAKSAFGTDEFELVLSNQGVSVNLTDINNDKLSFAVTEKVECLTDDESDFEFKRRFPIDVLLPLLKLDSNATLMMSERTGYIEMQVNNLTVCIMPRV